MNYGAKSDYQSHTSATTYERRAMYDGFVGKRRVRIERDVIRRLSASIEQGSTVLDCPCGNGRWFEALSANASKIIGVDVSEGMVQAARERVPRAGFDLDVGLGDAERLQLEDGEVDYTFSYALMKHLPVSVQYRVLSEFARVSSRGVICSFAVLTQVSYAWWRRRRPKESYPVIREELDFMAEASDLHLKETIKVSQPVVGLEYFAVFTK